MHPHDTLRHIGTTLCLVILAASAPLRTLAQHSPAQRRATQASNRLIERAAAQYSQKLDSILHAQGSTASAPRDSLLNPYYISLFSRPVLNDDLLHRIFSAESTTADATGAASGRLLEALPLIDSEIIDAYVAHAPLVKIDDREGGTPPTAITVPPAPQHFSISERYAPPAEDIAQPAPAEIFGPEDDDIIVRRPNFWTFKENFSLQFTQNYVSDNWYKGGESHNALLAATVLEANYNNQSRITFDNKLEMKLGFQTSQNDTYHKYKTNSDLIRLTNKFGLQAVKHWYYTAMLQSWTQFTHGYKSNDTRVYSDFMSPFESVFSIGMDYKQTSKNQKFNITATISPIALKFKYVGRPSLITYYGLDEGHHTKWEYGSNITVNYTWKIVKSVSWTGRIYFFTDYHSSQVEWENTFNLTINKYLSTKLFLFPRFDDSRTREEGDSNFEFKELLSLGLNINF